MVSRKKQFHLYKVWKGSGKENHKKKFIQYRNIFNKIETKAKKQYYSSELSKTSKSSKHHWNILKRACGMDEAKSKTNIELKDSNDIIISEPMEVANFFNEYFSTIGMTTVSKIPQCDIDFKAYLPNSKNSFVFS